ncbi:MAG: hypothetical protein R3F35_13860 [Myxococcota bacterium]
MSAAGLRRAGARTRGAGGAARGGRTGANGRDRQAWVGVDLSNEPIRPAPRGLYPLLALAVVAALGVAALRIDLLRTRYAVSSAMARENALIEEQRQLIVRRRELRDPVALQIQARERGFRPPVHVVSLPDPTLGSLESVVAPRPVIAPPDAVAAVAAAPPARIRPGGSEWE